MHNVSRVSVPHFHMPRKILQRMLVVRYWHKGGKYRLKELMRKAAIP